MNLYFESLFQIRYLPSGPETVQSLTLYADEELKDVIAEYTTDGYLVGWESEVDAIFVHDQLFKRKADKHFSSSLSYEQCIWHIGIWQTEIEMIKSHLDKETLTRLAGIKK